MVDLSERSRWFRREILMASGGWLGEIVPLIADAISIWDIFVLAALFMPAWIVLRVADSLTSMMLGFAFDGTIPLQHQLNPNKEPKHREHLASYWPAFFFATAVEFTCFVTIHPDLFTLVVCLKTALMTALWMGRRENGSFLVNSVGSKSGSGRTASTGRGSTASPGSSAAPASGDQPSKQETQEERWDRKLKAAGYDDEEARKAMIDALKRSRNPEKRLNDWLKEKDPKKKKETMEKMKKLKAEADAKKAEAEEAKKVLAENDGLSLANRPNPATAGRKGNTPDKVNPGDFQGNLMDIQPPDDIPVMKYETDDELVPVERRSPGLRERLGLKRRRPDPSPPPKGPAQQQPGGFPGGDVVEPPPPQLAWEGMSRRSRPGPGQQRQWAVFDQLQQSKPCFQYTGPADAPRAPWEKLLGHSSLELVDHYLRDAYVDYTARGQMLMDLFDHLEPGDIGPKWRPKHNIKAMVDTWKTAGSDEIWRKQLKPYVGLGWRPRNFAWESHEYDYADSVPPGELRKGTLDDISWLLRSKGFPVEVRRAMIRDLMSQSSRPRYRALYEALEKEANALEDFGETETEEQQAQREGLEQRYWTMTYFGGQFVISEERLKEVAGPVRSEADKMDLIRQLRKCNSEGALERTVEAFEDIVERAYGFNG